MTIWSELHDNLRADGINIKWIGNDDRVWHIGGMLAGAEGAFLIPPVKGMVHVPFKGVWHEPAYGPPRFERRIDERREIGTKIALLSDEKFGWFDVESRWWEGCDGENPGWFCVSTRKYGEVYVPAQLLDPIETELEDDPSLDGCQVWDVVWAVDGEPRWRQPDVRPLPWTNDMTTTTTVKRDDERLAPTITVGVGKFKIANRGTTEQWPIFNLAAPTSSSTPARYWLSNGATTDMVRVPPLKRNNHALIDTNPEHRIAIGALDPVDDRMRTNLRNTDLLSLLLGLKKDDGTLLEQFHGQGFNKPLPPREVSTITVYSDMVGAKVSVRLPQRFERPIS